jgi:hypothetical protein
MLQAGDIEPTDHSEAPPTASAASSDIGSADVRIECLPFFDVLGTLVEPSNVGMQTVYCF